jgi:septum formation protein
MRLLLASTSPARLTVLRAGGIEPVVIAPNADEEELAAVARAEGLVTNTQELVGFLARAKAESVLVRPEAKGTLVLGCDSSLEFEGESLGKPHEPQVAIARWRSLRGKSGVLHSGHWLIDNRGDVPQAVGASSSAKVFFANLSDREIEDYVATGEPLKVAGAFTIDGLGGAFLRGIEGDPHTVIGLSLPTLREMVGELGLHYPDLWNR